MIDSNKQMLASISAMRKEPDHTSPAMNTAVKISQIIDRLYPMLRCVR
jgi:hypothetical protein